ncbi:GNAT family N-acetyltransferase [Emcibacter sp. SYSU 3D8]|uniref:GNAT family N-acetyltransferase n=1 Tax=Emcibacter sp. SYSU 3D8 TaxID=3133969 RepID=UPI0031FF4737
MIRVRRLDVDDAAAFRAVRLECLRLHPENFGTVWEVERERPAGDFAATLAAHQFWGGFEGEALAGIVGFYVMPRAKERHRGVLYAMYVRESARGTGMAAALVQAVIEHARPLVDMIWLKVAVANAPARALYARFGFTVYGLEKASLRVGGRNIDQEYQVLALR